MNHCQGSRTTLHPPRWWMLLSILLTVLFAAQALVLAEVPDWVKNQGRSMRYDEFRYLTGFGLAKLEKNGGKAEATQVASDNAKKNLIERIRVNVSAHVESRREESGQNVSSYFSAAIQSSASMDLQGLETQFYSDETEGLMYALVVASKEKIAATCGKRAADLRAEIRRHVANGRTFSDHDERAKALSEYLSCYPLFRQLEEAEAILMATETNAGASIGELNGPVQTDQANVNNVRQAVDKLVQRPINTADDLAWYVVFTLNAQVDLHGKAIMVVPFTYQDTRLGSPFSRYVRQALEAKAVEVAKWEIVQQASNVQPGNRDVARAYAQASGADLVLSGTYWELPGGVKVQAILRTVADGKLVASAEAIVPLAVIQALKQSLKPQNFKEVFADEKEFRSGEVIGGGLNLEVWTNKGVENLLFTKGERMSVFMRVNVPCYVRLLYHLASGERVLLLDSHYIDESKVNKVYEIPQEFECDAPFGGEVLQVFARTEPFESVATIERDGYKFLKEGLKEVLASTRGFKAVKQKSMQAEQRVTITSMEK